MGDHPDRPARLPRVTISSATAEEALRLLDIAASQALYDRRWNSVRLRLMVEDLQRALFEVYGVGRPPASLSLQNGTVDGHRDKYVHSAAHNATTSSASSRPGSFPSLT